MGPHAQAASLPLSASPLWWTFKLSGRDRGLLLLHDGVCVDAEVEAWPEPVMDVKEGSRHRLRGQGDSNVFEVDLNALNHALTQLENEGKPDDPNDAGLGRLGRRTGDDECRASASFC